MTKKQVDRKIAAAYIRVSTDEQTEYSPQAQRKALEKYAAANNYELKEDDVFVDEGLSGRQAEKRPAFMRMIATAKNKERPFSAILVHKFDRFARSREDSVVYKSLLKKECGVRVISITESIEDDKFAVILEAMLEAMAEYYSINLGEEVKKGMTEKHLRGEWQSNPPFGYTVEEKLLVPLPEEAAVIREIFARFISGSGYYTIARWLNDLGIKTHRGNCFQSRTIEYVIQNPVYIGKLRWNPCGRSGRNFDRADILLTNGKHQPLIDMPTWEMAQNRAKEIKAQWKTHSLPAERKKDWLSGLIYCASCGSPLVFAKPHYWKCNGYAHGTCKVSQHATDTRLKEAILSALKRDTLTSSRFDYDLICHEKTAFHELEIWEKKRSQVETKLKKLKEAYLNGADTLAEYEAAKQNIQKEAAWLTEKIAGTAQEKKEKQPDLRLTASWRDPSLYLCSETITREKKYELAHSLIEKCVYDKANNLLNIYYRDPIVPCQTALRTV